MKYNFLLISALLALFSLSSCNEDPKPYKIYNNGVWVYDGGNAVVNTNDNVELQFDVQTNLNVDGDVLITDGISIGNDLNLNDGGKVIVNIPWYNDTVYINGNINLNDSLLFENGYIILEGNLNINATGIMNISDSSFVHVRGDVNNSGQLFGTNNLSVDGTFHANGGSTDTPSPLTY